MNKQEYLVKLLEALRWVRQPAEWFLVVMNAWWFDENIVDTLIHLIDNAIDKTNDIVAKKKLKSSVEVLKKVKSLEEASNEHDEKECEELLDLLDQIA